MVSRTDGLAGGRRAPVHIGRPLARFLTCAVAVLASVLAMTGGATAATPHAHPPSSPPDFGPNVTILDPSMSTSQIKAAFDTVSAAQISNQFGTQRNAILLKPGTYGSATDPINVQLGYYTDVAGLGSSPDDVQFNGTIDVYNQCFGPDDCTALVNFWRSISNLTINVYKPGDCHYGQFWATSQATSLRRVHVNGYASLMDYCSNPAYASGGFIADSQFSGGSITSGSQQQYLVRNSDIDPWSNGVWNQVFAGVTGAPAQGFPNPPYTTLPTNPESREKPFLYLDSTGHSKVFVPAVQRDGSGTTWSAGPSAGRSIPIEDFFIARPSDSVQAINNALAQGRNLLLTPGIYALSRTIEVKRPDTIVLGLGLATIVPQGGVVPMTVADVKGVEISDLIFDAGSVSSPVLLQVGKHVGHQQAREGNHWSDPADPSALHDVYFRIGGAHLGKAAVSLEVNAADVVLDNIWAWRADHGDGVGWTANTADTGVIVNGDDVIATGLFVEHYQKNEVIWNGENGRTIMFQNEMPYDPPNQAAWTQPDGTLGYAAFKVADAVGTFEGWGLGSYCFLNVDPTIHASHAFEVPVTSGVKLHDLLTLSITNHGTIDHVVNDFGDPTPPDTTRSTVVEYPGP
jgi:hypothetical protein